MNSNFESAEICSVLKRGKQVASLLPTSLRSSLFTNISSLSFHLLYF